MLADYGDLPVVSEFHDALTACRPARTALNCTFLRIRRKVSGERRGAAPGVIFLRMRRSSSGISTACELAVAVGVGVRILMHAD
jgi:hypothetical protein